MKRPDNAVKQQVDNSDISYSEYDTYDEDETLTSGTVSYYDDYMSGTDGGTANPVTKLADTSPEPIQSTSGRIDISYDDDKDDTIKDLRSKLAASETECKRLLSENMRLERELRSAYANVKTDGGSVAPQDRSVVAYQQELNKMQNKLQEKDDEINNLQKKLSQADDQTKNYRKELEEMVKIIDDDETKKAKRKTWYGAKKTYKPSGAARKVVRLQDEIEIAVTGDMTEKIAQKEKKKGGPLQEMLRQEVAQLKRNEAELKAKLDAREEERVRMVREKSKLEGETEILNRERFATLDKICKLEASNELLKSKDRATETQNALAVSKAIHLPVPTAGGDGELDRLRISVQIQEDALRRITVQKNQLQDALNTLEREHRHVFEPAGVETDNEGLRSLSARVAILTGEKKDLQEKVKRFTVKSTMLEEENRELRLTIQHLSDTTKKQGLIDKNLNEKRVMMLGHALTANEDLAAQVSKIKMKAVDDLMALNGEMLTLKTSHVDNATTNYALNKTAPIPKPTRQLYQHARAPSFSSSPSNDQPPPPSVTIVRDEPIKVERKISTEPDVKPTISSLPSEESSDTYTYEEIIASEEIPRPAVQAVKPGIQVLSEGHRYLPYPLRHSIDNAPKPVESETVYQQYAADALRQWNKETSHRVR